MSRFCLAFSMLFIAVSTVAFSPLATAAQSPVRCEPNDTEGQAMVDRINQRYDDFFRRRRQTEEQEQKRESGAGDVKKARHARDEELRKAAAAYRREKPKADPRLEEQWTEEQKRQAARLEEARRCLVQKRNAVRALEAKGRKIPGRMEYDIEDD